MTADLPCIWVNGVEADHISMLDRGLSYGDGLFETVRLHRGQPVWLRQHFERLSSGIDRLGIDVNLSRLKHEVQHFLQVASHTEGVLKIMLTRGVGGRGYAPPSMNESSRIISLFPLPVYAGEPDVNGVALFPCETRLAHQPLLAGLKHLNRLEQVLARAELLKASVGESTEWREGLCRDYDGNIICGTMSNIFLRVRDVWHTPALDLCGIAGIFRRFVLDNAASWGEVVRIGPCDDDVLRSASEVFMCNSVFGIWPVTEFCGQQWSVGSSTRQIQNKFIEVMND